MSNITEALRALSPVACDYQEWVQVGMALYNEGMPCADWDTWSRNDPRYREGECVKKWAGFQPSTNGVAGGTIVKLAMDKAGFVPVADTSDVVYDWNSEIRVGGEEPEPVGDVPIIVHKGYMEPADIKPLETTPNNDDLRRYLEAVFQPDDFVGYSVESFMSPPDKEGNTRMLPTKGMFTRKAKDIIAELERYGKFGATCIPKALGQWNESVGAWIRFNPLDGKDCKDINVTQLRHALVECDNIPPEQQLAIIRELQLPCTAIVHSGKKSVHAIVRVDASNMAEYRKRVDFLYGVCAKNGLTIDTQNKNPSRLSRMPGVTRNGVVQALLDTHAGQPDWATWENWLEEQTDDLPEPVCMADIIKNPPPLPTEIIKGVLRKGHKMLLTAASKAGKTTATDELCLAFATGGEWLGHSCIQGDVINLDFESDPAICYDKFMAMGRKLKFPDDAWRHIHVWSLRGRTAKLERLVKSIVRRAMKIKPVAIILDPLYKVQLGDENSASDVAEFFCQIDRICAQTGVAIIMTHHHSKGDQGQKKAMDRSSGSGVFHRDPDAMMDFIELPPTEDVTEAYHIQHLSQAVMEFTDKHGLNFNDTGDFTTAKVLAKNSLMAWPQFGDELRDIIYNVGDAVSIMSHWRIEYTLRGFKPRKPVNMTFMYPLHMIDKSGVLDVLKPNDGRPEYMKEQDKKKDERQHEFGVLLGMFVDAWDALPDTSNVTVLDMATAMFINESKVRKIIKSLDEFDVVKGVIVRKE